MSLKAHGKSISDNEVTSIGEKGFWLLYKGKEYFVPFQDYPIFKNATVKEIYSMKVIAPGHLRWETIDCDIEIEALERPENYPLIYR